MKRTVEYIHKTLIRSYSQEEISSFINIIFHNIYNYSKKDLILNADKTLEVQEIDKIEHVVNQLLNNVPIQYIFRNTEFYDLQFYVNENVLIPRFETEELVDLIIKQHKNSNVSILDIGTGSGCIAISLAKNLPNATVYACDISKEALNIARQNAKSNNAKVEFIHCDITDPKLTFDTHFDLIVSNPPYVRNSEKALMHANVLDYEPHGALFVNDNDPLLFYKTIVNVSSSILNSKGYLYFEINEAFGSEVVDLCKNHYFDSFLMKDLNGKDRIVFGQKL